MRGTSSRDASLLLPLGGGDQYGPSRSRPPCRPWRRRSADPAAQPSPTPAPAVGCFEDWGTCCYGFFCTPCLFGDNSQALGRDWFENCFCWYCCGCLACLMTENRAKLRQAHGLKEAPLNDCLTYFL